MSTLDARRPALVRAALDTRLRRRAYAVLALVFLVLMFVPRPYIARAKIVPQDTSASAASTTALLGALGSNAQGIGSLLTGGRPSNDLYLIIGRSDSVTEEVIRRLNLVGQGRPYASDDAAKLGLARKVDVHLLLGGVMEVVAKTHDRAEAERLTQAYVDAISVQLASFGKQLIVKKQRIVEQRYKGSAARVSATELALNDFRRANNLAAPESQLGSALSLRAELEGQLQAKLVQLQALQQVRGPDNSELVTLQAEIASIRQQIARSATPASSPAGPNVSGISGILTRYYDLFRDYQFAQGIYQIYARSLEQVEVEELAAESASYVQIIDAPHLDAERHLNTFAVAGFLAVLLAALFTEWYGPRTGLFGPWPLHREDGLA